MSVPDAWRVVGEDRPDAGLLLVGKERFEPALSWMKKLNVDAFALLG